MSVARFAARFVGDVPEELAPGLVYVSIEHATTAHLCACGCGSEVVLPLSPLDWRFTWDGERISVAPSVGSWSLPCRSHYFISDGRVRWAGDWSEEKVAAGRARDRRERERRFADASHAAPGPSPTPSSAPTPTGVDSGRPTNRGWRLAAWLRGLLHIR